MCYSYYMCSGSTAHDCTQCWGTNIRLYEYKSGGSEGYFCDSFYEDESCKEGYFLIFVTKSVRKIITGKKTVTHEDLGNPGQLITKTIKVNEYEEIEELVEICAKWHNNCKESSSYETDEQQNCDEWMGNHYY